MIGCSSPSPQYSSIWNQAVAFLALARTTLIHLRSNVTRVESTQPIWRMIILISAPAASRHFPLFPASSSMRKMFHHAQDTLWIKDALQKRNGLLCSVFRNLPTTVRFAPWRPGYDLKRIFENIDYISPKQRDHQLPFKKNLLFTLTGSPRHSWCGSRIGDQV